MTPIKLKTSTCDSGSSSGVRVCRSGLKLSLSDGECPCDFFGVMGAKQTQVLGFFGHGCGSDRH